MDALILGRHSAQFDREGEIHLHHIGRLSCTAHLIHHLGCGTERRTASTASEMSMCSSRLQRAQLAMSRGEEIASRAFYAGVLGMIESTSLRRWPRAAVRGFPVTSSCNSADDFSAARNAHPGVLVNDRDPLVARLAAAKQAVSSGADLPGLRRIYLHDPFRNRLEFLQPSE